MYSAPRWSDRAESVVTQSVLAMVSHAKVSEEIGERSTQQLRDVFTRHAPRDPQFPADLMAMQQYGYHADWETSYTELLVAAWLSLGRDVAAEMARDRYGRNPSWMFPVSVRVAQSYRVFATPRDRNRADAALNLAYNAGLRRTFSPMPSDCAMFGFEAASLRKNDLIAKFLERKLDSVVAGYTAMGAAEALLGNR